MSLDEQIIAIVLLPLLAAAITGLNVRSMAPQYAQIITCGALIMSALLSASVFSDVALMGATRTIELGTWINSGDFVVNWALRVDVLTAVMLVVVTWVSSVVHVYSVGYMEHDAHRQRFMCYLSLFTFAMLMLVTADNFIQLFFGWEGVGLCSYLLIGFWFKKDSANAASMKAFIVNRVGDFGFALGIMAVFLVFGTVQFDDVFVQVSALADVPFDFLGYPINTMDIICLLLFIGAMGKSAQLLLHTWLPDAMEGPTPVSALIHAATMVTAGVFLVARCSPMFEYAPLALQVVTIVGASTAIFAATVGMVQNDIKRVIAYSTCSQLGYMFFACGVSAYAAGVFHLMTHAFFKALLFLGAGSVIHAMSDEQDMRNMGGIWRKVPYTYAFMWIGSLALAGIPLFAGYYSKDIIIEAAYADHTIHGQYAFWMGVVAALLTAFYSWRLIIMTFHGRTRASKEVFEHVHESPKIMLMPLILLVLGALFSGYIGYKGFGMVNGDGDFWRGAITVLHDNNVLEEVHHVPSWVIALPMIVALSGIMLAWVLYMKLPMIAERMASIFRPVYQFFLNKWYFDELYNVVFVRGAFAKGKLFWKYIDMRIIDGLGPNGFAALTQKTAAITSRLQTGFLYHYAFAMLAGLMVMITMVIVIAGGVL